MSGSEKGAAVMMSSFTIGVHNTPPASSQPITHTMRLSNSSDGTAVYKPLAGSSTPFQPATSGGGATVDGQASVAIVPHNLNVNVGETVKKEREAQKVWPRWRHSVGPDSGGCSASCRRRFSGHRDFLSAVPYSRSSLTVFVEES